MKPVGVHPPGVVGQRIAQRRAHPEPVRLAADADRAVREGVRLGANQRQHRSPAARRKDSLGDNDD